MMVNNLGCSFTNPSGSIPSLELREDSQHRPLTARTICNTDHIMHDDSEDLSQAHEGGEISPPSFSGEKFLQQGTFNNEVSPTPSPLGDDHLTTPFLAFGAQFDNQLPEDGNVYEEDIIQPTPTTKPFDALGHTSPFANYGSITSNTASSKYNMKHPYPRRTSTRGDRNRVTGVLDGEDDTYPEGEFRDIAETSCGREIPSIVVSDHTANQFIGLSCFAAKCLSLTPWAPMNHAYEVLHLFNTQWKDKLALAPKIHIPCPNQSTHQLLVDGARILQRCYGGILPENFEPIFALMLFAFTCQHVVDVEIRSTDWHDFSHNVYSWGRALLIPAQLQLFDKVWNRIWSPQASTEISLLIGSGSFGSPYTHYPVSEDAAQESHRTSKSPTHSIWEHDDAGQRTHPNVRAMLIGGTVMQACSRFLNGDALMSAVQDDMLTLTQLSSAML